MASENQENNQLIIDSAISSLKERQALIKDTAVSVAAIKSTLPQVEISKMAVQIAQQMPEMDSLKRLADGASNVQFKMNPNIEASISAIKTFYSNMASIAETASKASIVLTSALTNYVQSPFVKWLTEYDFSPILRAFESIAATGGLSSRIKEFKSAYLQAMYDCQWFPYAGLYANVGLLKEINQILVTSRGKSKRRTARMDKAILTYYNTEKILEIKKRWKNSNLESHIKKILGQAIEAHIRGEYVLTVSCLATMWEGLLKQKMPIKKRKKEELENDIKGLVVDNGYEKILGDYYNNLIISTCYGLEDVKEGVPNRTGIAHSWYKKYPNKKASLNAILLTDFIINLNPRETAEVTENGQTENANSEQG